ncbi:MAG: glutamate synthase subunit alpha [Spirochaetes bacterium GWB1_36_13]|nr:MAG: glutamate synthase subunit alpha [Spirochaetes bacterium GWB1_36_13]
MAAMYPSNQGLYDSQNEHDSCGIGFVANIKGKKSYNIIERGLEVLERMEHRGAESADNKTGDGAGILFQIPHNFYQGELKGLPEFGKYGTGLVFLPKDEKNKEKVKAAFEKVIKAEGLEVFAFRKIEVDSSAIGDIALKSEPSIEQVFITGKDIDSKTLERKLYIVRKLSEKTLRESKIEDASYFYMPSLSSKTIVYKGMLMPDQVKKYFKDLQNPKMESAIALVHSRFSTNTFPAWELAQPFRIVAHNGEINTVKGNRFWMQARESMLESKEFGKDIAKILPVIEPGKSDSASFDNALEMLVAAGRSLPHALMMMIPESWNEKNPISKDIKSFYEYHSTFMEPWDGPASMVFCDGRFVGGTLDRNGLRPSRYVITKNDMIVMGSEVGVQEFAPEEIASKGRLLPGKLLLVDTQEGRIIPDNEIKSKIANQKPYGEWVEKNRLNLPEIAESKNQPAKITGEELKKIEVLFKYSREDLESIIKPMAVNGEEPTGSMGTDTPIAAFSDKPELLFNYFKQTFAQVTNPAIDPIREELVMTLTSYIGSQKNLLDETPEHCQMIKFKTPIFTDKELQKIKDMNHQNFKPAVFDIVFKASEGEKGLEKALDKLAAEIEKKVDQGTNIIILSDRKAGKDMAPIPSLLASAGVHHHLIRVKKRTRIGLVIETAEAREVMHFALLFGYGADAVNPYGAFAVIEEMAAKNEFAKDMTADKAVENFIKANKKGLLKVLSKMGTSTLRSYRAAQIFEAIGLGNALIEKYFTGTQSRIGGVGINEIAAETLLSHKKVFIDTPKLLESEGIYRFRKNGHKHAWNPETIYLLQWATRTGDYQKYKQFSKKADQDTMKPHFIRGLFDFKKQNAVPLSEVESAESIYKRFTTGAMSFGSLSKEVHEAMAIALNAIGGRSNSGEGGEDPERFKRRSDGTLPRSAIKQVASGRFGVTSNYLANADEIQIKISQGAKPGEGGQLPGHKVDEIIARTRYSTPGVTLISPPPHHDIYSIEDLAQLIYDLKNANPRARISVKLVSESGVGTVAAGVAKAHADNILISGYDGGTGASPQSSIKHAGLPWEIGLAETHQTLVLNDLRGRVRLQTDGQIKTGKDIVIAAILGAEEFGFGTSALIVLGCVMMRKCHLNTCPVGVATQDPELRKRFGGKPEYLINYFKFMAEEVREIMASLGIRKFDDLVGNTRLVEKRNIDHWKAKTIDPKALLYIPEEAKKHALFCVQDQIHKIDDILDRKLIEKAKSAIESKQPVKIEMPITNLDRSTGTMLSYEVSTKYGDDGLPENTIQCLFKGSAGQSFGAFLAKGIEFRLEGDSNDYFGKGLSGGRLIAVPPKASTFKPEENIIIGNTVLYGATDGEVFVRGIAGERFCVRNSGAKAVIEGTGDHGAEYMTGGLLIVLGKVGRNFGAAMSGGVAFVLDKDGSFDFFCNKGMVELTPINTKEDEEILKTWIEKHLKYTESTVAKEILDNWAAMLPQFVKVMPLEYKRALEEMKIKALEKELKTVREEEELKDSR